MIGGGGDEDIDIAVGVVAPGNIEIAAFFSAARIIFIDDPTGIDADLGEAVRARYPGDAEIAGSGGNDAAIFAEGSAAIVGNGHHDAVAVVPDGIERAVRTDNAMKTLQSAVVIARQAGDAVELDRLRPALAAVSRA